METTRIPDADPGFIGRMSSVTREDLAAIFDLPTTILMAVTLLSFIVPALLIWPPVPIRISEALNQTHTRLGLEEESGNKRGNGKPKGARKHTVGGGAAEDEGPPRIDQLVTYPVKSCRGISVTKSKVLPTGLEYDRLFSFAQQPRSRPPQAAGGGAGPKAGDEDAEKRKQKAGEQQDEGRGTMRTRSAKKKAVAAAAAAAAAVEKEVEDEGVWEALTQRQCPLLATVRVEIWRPDAAKIRRKVKLDEAVPDETWLLLRFPRRRSSMTFIGWVGAWLAAKMAGPDGWRGVPETEVLLPVVRSAAELDGYGYPARRLRIWKDTVVARDLGAELPAELRDYLAIPPHVRLGLFRLGEGAEREVFRAAPRRDDVGYQPIVGFQDAYPLHLLNIESVKDVEKKMKEGNFKHLDPNRFRANIIISNTSAYSEEGWKVFSLEQGSASIDAQDCKYHVSCRAARCKMPNIDQDTGKEGDDATGQQVQPEAFLRKNHNVDQGCPENGCLGMMLTPAFTDTSSADTMVSYLEVGMELTVEETGDHVYIKM